MLTFEKAKTYVGTLAAKRERVLTSKDVAEAREYIHNYWQHLLRYHPKDEGSLIGLPHPYIAPSRSDGHEFDFDELFYWDSFFTIQGLWDDEHKDLIIGIVDDLAYMFKHFGIIPNSSQHYMTGRSQPPLLTSMIMDIEKHFHLDNEWLNAHMKVAMDEYSTVWMGKRKPHARQVYRGLSRYYDLNYINDIAEAESGWDMTPRFYRKALDFLPVDLNSLLYKYEVDFSKLAKQNGDNKESERWESAALQRQQTMNELMWDKSKGLYYDYDYIGRKKGSVASLASYFPMWAGMVSEKQASILVNSLKRFENKGGLATTDFTSAAQFTSVPTQWSYPNGWAPLHFIVVQGLERYGYHHEARRIATKWLTCNLEWYKTHGEFLEKYNVVNLEKPPQQGLYPSQVGFGWTNAIFERFCQDYVDRLV